MLLFLVFFVCHAPSPDRHAFEGCIVRTRIALPFIGRFRQGLQRFFHKRLLIQTRYIVVTFVARWHHNCREIEIENCEKFKNRRKSLCDLLRIRDSWEIWRMMMVYFTWLSIVRVCSVALRRRLRLQFDFGSTPIRLPFDRATTIRRPTSRPGCGAAA